MARMGYGRRDAYLRPCFEQMNMGQWRSIPLLALLRRLPVTELAAFLSVKVEDVYIMVENLYYNICIEGLQKTDIGV